MPAGDHRTACRCPPMSRVPAIWPRSLIEFRLNSAWCRRPSGPFSTVMRPPSQRNGNVRSRRRRGAEHDAVVVHAVGLGGDVPGKDAEVEVPPASPAFQRMAPLAAAPRVRCEADDVAAVVHRLGLNLTPGLDFATPAEWGREDWWSACRLSRRGTVRRRCCWQSPDGDQAGGQQPPASAAIIEVFMGQESAGMRHAANPRPGPHGCRAGKPDLTIRSRSRPIIRYVQGWLEVLAGAERLSVALVDVRATIGSDPRRMWCSPTLRCPRCIWRSTRSPTAGRCRTSAAATARWSTAAAWSASGLLADGDELRVGSTRLLVHLPAGRPRRRTAVLDTPPELTPGSATC